MVIVHDFSSQKWNTCSEIRSDPPFELTNPFRFPLLTSPVLNIIHYLVTDVWKEKKMLFSSSVALSNEDKKGH